MWLVRVCVTDLTYDLERPIVEALEVVDCPVQRFTRYDNELSHHELDFVLPDDNIDDAKLLLSEILCTIPVITGVLFDYCELEATAPVVAVEEVF